MKALIIAIGFLGLAAPWAAGDTGVTLDKITLADKTERVGTVVAIDAADVYLKEKTWPPTTTRMIPRAEVRRIDWANGDVSSFAVVEDRWGGAAQVPGSVRSSTLFQVDDLELSPWEVAYSSFGRGVLAGGIAMMFPSEVDEKKKAFALGFLAHFGLSLYLGW